MEVVTVLKEQTVINECYILQSRLGEDSFTEHWSATAIFSAKKFLIRFLNADIDPAMTDKLRETAMRSYRVQGSAIADIIEFESYEGRAFIASELRAGGTLDEYGRSENRLKIEDVCSALLSLARGLSVFHDQGIVYGNLNGEQVLVGPKGSFSSSIRIQKPSMHVLAATVPPGDARVTANYAYASLACKAGKIPTAPDDIYSLGIHLVRLLTGKLPFPDDEAFVRTEGASLTFTANSLLRRGIWPGLVAVALRALMEDSPSRYRSCAEFIEDLRSFMESEKILTGSRDEYFRQANAGRGAEKAAEYPSVPRDDAGVVERIERDEARAKNRDGEWTVEDYIRAGIETIRSDRSGELFGVPVLPVRAVQSAMPIPPSQPATPEPPTQPALPAQPVLPELSAPSAPSVTKVATLSPMPPVVPAISESSATAQTATQTVTTAVVKPAIKKRTAKKSPANRTGANQIAKRNSAGNAADTAERSAESVPERAAWNYHRVRYEDVVKIIDISVARAKKGSGSFRFIQEPEDTASSSRLFHALEKIGAEATYVNVGSLEQYGTADIGDFLSMIRAALARALSGFGDGERRYLAGKVRAFDAYGAFASAPTGRLLYGSDGPDIEESVLDTVACQEATASALFAFGGKKRPLVVAVRHAECATRELDAFLNRLARLVSARNACILAFFAEGDVASWHSLATIARFKFETGEAMSDS